MTEIWSNTDFPYMCLKDEARTLAFRDAIRAVVRPGDVVVDVGAGTGILSFFAARAGAAKVFAVEIDPVCAAALRRSIALNGVADRVTVVEGDAGVVDLPRDVDVVVAEIIETGLLDEQQVPVLNALRRRGVITEATRLVPAGYETTLQLVSAEHRYYGFEIAAPKHEWPFYASGAGWHATPVTAASAPVITASADFTAGLVDEEVAGEAELEVDPTTTINAVRLAGRLDLCAGRTLGPTHALNGDKILPIAPLHGVSRARLRWRYRMGAGLGALEVTCEPAATSARPPLRMHSLARRAA
jgi:SAM-dependent methyltransferase